MKAKDIMKIGFFMYIGWEVSRVIDKVLGVKTMDWLKVHYPDFHDKLKAEMDRIH